jgi:hypothetical protein
MNWRE